MRDDTRLVRRGWLIGGASAVLFGATTPAAKYILRSVPSMTLAGLLYVGAALISAPIVLRQRSTRPSRIDLWRLGGAVVVGGAVAPVLLLLGLQRTPASSASLLLNLELVATTLIAWLTYHEHIGRRAGLGLVILTGAGLLLTGVGGGLTSAAALVAGACVCWGIDNNLTANAESITPAQVTLAKGAIAGSVNLVLGLLIEGSAPQASSIGWALLVGGLGYGLSIILWVTSARILGTARSQGVFATAPFVGVVIGWALLDEPIRGIQLVALAAMGLGIWLALTSAHGHRHRHPPTLHAHAHRHDDGHHDHSHDEVVVGSHTHEHDHRELVHAHQHLPDVHHRHEHHG